MTSFPSIARACSRPLGATLLATLATLASLACAQSAVTFHPPPGGGKPSYSEAVEVRGAGVRTLYVSALVPEPLETSAAKDSPAVFGDTRAQTEGILRRLKALLERRSYSMQDVVKVTVFLVADPALGGSVDNVGFSAGYDAFFGASGASFPPARTRATVAALTNPLWRVAVDAVVVRAAP